MFLPTTDITPEASKLIPCHLDYRIVDVYGNFMYGIEAWMDLDNPVNWWIPNMVKNPPEGFYRSIEKFTIGRDGITNEIVVVDEPEED